MLDCCNCRRGQWGLFLRWPWGTSFPFNRTAQAKTTHISRQAASQYQNSMENHLCACVCKCVSVSVCMFSTSLSSKRTVTYISFSPLLQCTQPQLFITHTNISEQRRIAWKEVDHCNYNLDRASEVYFILFIQFFFFFMYLKKKKNTTFVYVLYHFWGVL